MSSTQEERKPEHTEMREWMVGVPTREQVRRIKDALRHRLNPALACGSCEDPQCCRMGVRVFPSEAEDIIDGHKSLVEKKFKAITTAADSVVNKLSAKKDSHLGVHPWCLFSQKKGKLEDRKCAIYADAPWHCAVFGLLKGDNPANCHVDVVCGGKLKRMGTHFGSPHEFGFIFLELFEARMHDMEKRRSLAAAYEDVGPDKLKLLPVAILHAMARREFVTHGSGRWVDAMERIYKVSGEEDDPLEAKVLEKLDEAGEAVLTGILSGGGTKEEKAEQLARALGMSEEELQELAGLEEEASA